MDLERYTQALVDYATQKNSVALLEAMRDDLWNKIKNNEGKTLVNTSPTGKSFGWQVTLSNEDAFACVVKAIKIFNGEVGDGPVTFIDFSRIDTRTPNSLPLDPLLY